MLATQNSLTSPNSTSLVLIKTVWRSWALLLLVVGITGCAPMPTVTNTVTYPSTVKAGDVVETAIDVAREMKFPPATKIDKTEGLVEFGNFGQPMMGITAQVRIKSEGQLDVTVTRGSVYVALAVDKTANEFKNKIEERLRVLGDKTAK
jgi:hypothetical protein